MTSPETPTNPIAVTYPSELPISGRRDELLTAIRENQVLVVAGETGSGKSTQLPKMCVELGLHEDGWIGHTQPRRIAARSIAERVAEELNDEVGGVVGYKVRFTDKVSKRTAIKAMTDGILLAEMQTDRNLSAYSVIIIDEAHERSLNIDFLLGYLRQLLPKRPDLKVIITSATIDTDRFSAHFGDAPIIEVSGRTFPVEIRYRPLVDPKTSEAIGQAEGIVEAVEELELEGNGDILVFCSGERDIREASDALAEARFRNTEVVPLYGRLSAAEQHRVFERKRNGMRRIVVATNVAETSLTVPGIRYVVDPGTARISRYSHRTKVQRLPIEDVSQASANQRSGRCGRVAAGVCIRLYDEDNFANRPEFTEPEITRTSLASVILQMANLNLGSIEEFPFVDPPELRNIKDGVALLEELNAINPDVPPGTKKWLTNTGRQLARLPIDPRLGAMVIDASNNGCLYEVMVIAAAMSVQDPRERPRERREEAGELHSRFNVPGSDFLAWVELWDYIQEERDRLSHNQFRKLCKRELLNYNRIREWWDIFNQLERSAKQLKWNISNKRANPDHIHQSLLCGLLSQVGLKDQSSNEFSGGRQTRFIFGRGSVLAKKPPNWVMAGELVETNRLWAHSGARIQPEWAERAGNHVVKRSYDEPQWDAEKGSAMTIERATLYGVPLVAGRKVHYRRVDPTGAREMFIHQALIEGEWETHHAFFAQNEGVLNEVRRLGARQRQDLTVDYDVLYKFYDERVAETVTSGADFDKWWNKRRKKDPRLLDLVLDEIFDVEQAQINEDEFPEVWDQGDLQLEVDYEFATASDNDGVTVMVPVALLDHIDTHDFEWNVPGLRAEIVEALLRAMPKNVRKSFLPIPHTVQTILPGLQNAKGSLVASVRAELRKISNAELPADALAVEKLPPHLRPIFQVVTETGSVLARGRDLQVIRAQLKQEVNDVLATSEHSLLATGQTRWTFGALPKTVETEAAGQSVVAYPSLVDEGKTVGVALLADADSQYESMWAGTTRLLRLNVGGSARLLNELLDDEATFALATSPHGSKLAWVNDAADAIFGNLLEESGGLVWDEASWDYSSGVIRSQLAESIASHGQTAVGILKISQRLKSRLAEPVKPKLHPAYRDMIAQLNRLVYPNHLTSVGTHRWDDVLRYLRAIEMRLDKVATRVTRDSQQMWKCQRLEAELEEFLTQLNHSQKLEQLNWMLEEFRVASFAQSLGAKGKVSEERIRAELARL